MASLKRLSSATAVTPAKSSGSDIPVIQVEDDSVTQYNLAVEASKAADAVVAEVKPGVLKTGLTELYKKNLSNPTPVSSVKLMDRNGSVVMVSNQNKYSAVNADVVCKVLDQVAIARSGMTHDGRPVKEIDPNPFVQEIVAPKFDSAVFYNADGTFNERIFAAYNEAIVKATAAFVREGLLPVGTATPLTGARMFKPLETFHAARWVAFPRVDEQQAVFAAMPNTVTMKVVTTVEADQSPAAVIAAAADASALLTARELRDAAAVATSREPAPLIAHASRTQLPLPLSRP